MPVEPLVKARHMQSLFAKIERLPEVARRAIRERTGDLALRQISEAATSDWLPLSLDLAVTRELQEVLGTEGAHRFFHDHQLEAFGSATFRMLVEGATTLFGLDPGSWARWVPRGWGLVFKDCGEWLVERSAPGTVDLALVRPPTCCLADAVWLQSLAWSLSAILDLAHVEGRFTLERVDEERQTALYALCWRPSSDS